MKLSAVNSSKKTISREKNAARNLGDHVDVRIIIIINKHKFGESRRLFNMLVSSLLWHYSKRMSSVKGVTLRIFICSDFVPH
jgi:hypothetical protein